MSYTIPGFVALLAGAVARETVAEHAALERASKLIEDAAKAAIGTYDYGWTPLAESTLARKAADTPLLETGEMQASIEHDVGTREAMIGTDNEKATWQELGTNTIPARSFLAESAIRNENEIVEILGRAVEFFLP